MDKCIVRLLHSCSRLGPNWELRAILHQPHLREVNSSTSVHILLSLFLDPCGGKFLHTFGVIVTPQKISFCFCERSGYVLKRLSIFLKDSEVRGKFVRLVPTRTNIVAEVLSRRTAQRRLGTCLVDPHFQHNRHHLKGMRNICSSQ